MKLQVHHTYKKDERLTTDFKPINNEDVINKPYLYDKFIEINGRISLLEKDYNESKLQYNNLLMNL